jgi:hypothetical protein
VQLPLPPLPAPRFGARQLAPVHGTTAIPVHESEQIFDPALRAANQALSGRKRREVSRIASIELRFTDARSGAWEALAMLSVGVATVIAVIGVWFL